MRSGKSSHIGEYAAMLLIWLGLLLAFGLLTDKFLSWRTVSALANRVPALVVVSAGMTLVLVIGGIDLSVGSVLGLSGAVLGVALKDWHWPFLACVLVCLGVATMAGVLNGLISVQLGVPSFIVTLGMLEVARGLAYLATHSQTKYLGDSLEALAQPLRHLGCSPAFLISIVVVTVTQLVLTRSVFGRYLVAIGTNEQAVRLAGINPRVAKMGVFALSGLLSGAAAIFYTARLGSSDPNAGVGFELSAIAAVVIGGTSLMGGRGSAISSFFGVLIIATLESGLAQLGASEPVKRVVTGAVIVLAVVIDAWRHHLPGARLAFVTRLFGLRPTLPS
jgi:ribose transport system permease protein